MGNSLVMLAMVVVEGISEECVEVEKEDGGEGY